MLVAATLALLLAGGCAVYALLSWWQLRRSLDAAEALADVHMQSLNGRIASVEAAAQLPARRAEDLQAQIASLQRSVAEASYLLGLIPRERARLRRRLADILLPTERAR